jgi:hypothetical protein
VILPDLVNAAPSVQRAHRALFDHVAALEQDDVRPSSALKTRHELQNHKLRDLLVAHLIAARATPYTVTATGISQRRAHIRRVVSQLFNRQLNATLMGAVRTLVDVATTYPENAIALAGVLSWDTQPVWPHQIAETDDVGRLTREVYDAAMFHQLIARTDYLQRRTRAAIRLSAVQGDLARTLSSNWAGTLEELIDTAVALDPEVHLAHASG